MENHSIRVEIYPHPVVRFALVTVKGACPDAALEFELYSALGKRKKCIKMDERHEFLLSREGLEGGLYLYTVLHGKQVLQTGKLLVSHQKELAQTPQKLQ